MKMLRITGWAGLLGAWMVACTGPAGPAGAPGAPGANGANGTSGTNGTNGADGANGTNGTTSDGGAACVPNQQTACQCASGASGFQQCDTDGLRVGACLCFDAGLAADGATFSVGGIPGLSVWLKGDKGIIDDLAKPGHVKRWVDQSGNGNDAQKSTSGELATHDPSAVNGIDAVELTADTQGLEIADAPSLRFGTGDYAVIFVAKIISTHNEGALVLAKDDLTIAVGSGGSTLVANVKGQTASVSIPAPAKWGYYALRGSQVRFESAGSSSSGGTPSGDITPNASPMRVIQNANDDELAEVIIVKGTVSDADLANVKAYLTAKYAL